MKELVVATGNMGKLKEFQALFAKAGLAEFSLHSLKEYPNYQAPLEDAPSFIGNALIKAYHASSATGHGAIADDSGLCVASLNDGPGIYSARFGQMENFVSGEEQDKNNYLCMLNKLAQEDNRKAYFYCCIVYVRFPNDPTPIVAFGKCHGEILKEARGANGHGYDPIFFSPELGKSFAEASMEEKNQVSHRVKAFENFLAQLKQTSN